MKYFPTFFLTLWKIKKELKLKKRKKKVFASSPFCNIPRETLCKKFAEAKEVNVKEFPQEKKEIDMTKYFI